MSYPLSAINEAFALLPSKMDTKLARIQHAAIGFQETKYLTRVQYGGGPARSYWQFENGRLAGINGVLTHSATTDLAKMVCKTQGVEPERMAVWKAMETDDVLGAAFARLLMYTDAGAMPKNADEGWAMYLRTWRPGKPHPKTWPQAYADAQAVV